MKRHCWHWLIAVCGLCVSFAPSASEHEINWSSSISPPFHIVDGPLAQQGLCDVLVDSFQRSLPETQHHVDYLPASRIDAIWTDDKDLCFPCMIHRTNDPSSSIIFSEPTHQYPSHGIITRPELADELVKKYGSPIDLELLLADKQYLFVQPAARRYGKLQYLIEQYLDDSSLHVELTSVQANTAMLAMILHERADFTIDYPMLKTFYEKTEQGKLAFLPISQLADEQIIGAVACTRTDLGIESIRRINSAIPKVKADPAFQHALKQWLEPIQP